MIRNEITVTLLSVKGNQVRLEINAPKDVAVHREEVYDRVQQEKMEQQEYQLAIRVSCGSEC